MIVCICCMVLGVCCSLFVDSWSLSVVGCSLFVLCGLLLVVFVSLFVVC